MPDSAKAVSLVSIPPHGQDAMFVASRGRRHVTTRKRHGRGGLATTSRPGDQRAQELPDALEALACKLVMRSCVGLVPAPIVSPVTARSR